MDEEALRMMIKAIVTRTSPRQCEPVLRELRDLLARGGEAAELVELAGNAAESAAALRSLSIAGSAFTREEMNAAFARAKEI